MVAGEPKFDSRAFFVIGSSSPCVYTPQIDTASLAVAIPLIGLLHRFARNPLAWGRWLVLHTRRAAPPPPRSTRAAAAPVSDLTAQADRGLLRPTCASALPSSQPPSSQPPSSISQTSRSPSSPGVRLLREPRRGAARVPEGPRDVWRQVGRPLRARLPDAGERRRRHAAGGAAAGHVAHELAGERQRERRGLGATSLLLCGGALSFVEHRQSGPFVLAAGASTPPPHHTTNPSQQTNQNRATATTPTASSR